MKRVSIFLITITLIAGTVGCVGGDGNNGGESYTLIVDFTAGGTVTVDDLPIPGKAILTYDAGTVVSLNATPSTGYRFVEWTGNVSTITDVNAATTTIAMNGDYSIMASFMVLSTPMVAAGEYHTLGLRSDGTVVAAGTEVELAKWDLIYAAG